MDEKIPHRGGGSSAILQPTKAAFLFFAGTGGYYSNFLGETSMGDYIPGTGSDSSFGKTYTEVFAPNVAGFLKWIFRIGVGFAVLAWIGGTLRDVATSGIGAAGRVALAVYLSGVKAGIEYEKHG